MNQALSERERGILREVVEIYLATGEPVASAAVSRRSLTGLSSPSIRNVMAELEQKGLLVQPHTSSGRVPSDIGFRVFVDDLLQHPALPAREQRRLRALLDPSGPLEEVLDQASKVLAAVTAEVGLAVAPASQRAVLRSIHFVLVASNRVMAVVVTQGGLVESRLLVVERDYQQSELDRVSNFCTENFAGLQLAEIRRRLLSLMVEERTRWDELITGVVELGNRAVSSDVMSGGEVFLRGTERLLDHALPGQLEAMRRLYAAFADKTSLLALLDQYLTGVGPRAILGSELSGEAGGEISVVLTSFQLPTGESGVVGVLGHKRMDYPHIIPIVDYIGHYLGEGGGTDVER